MKTRNMPGFTAEQSLKQHQGNYSQRSGGRPVERVGEVCPQIPFGGRSLLPIILAVANRCCLDGNLNCCKIVGSIISRGLGGG